MKKVFTFILILVVALAFNGKPHRTRRLVINCPDTTYTLTCSEFDGFIQTNRDSIYLRSRGDTLELVIGGTQYILEPSED